MLDEYLMAAIKRNPLISTKEMTHGAHRKL